MHTGPAAFTQTTQWLNLWIRSSRPFSPVPLCISAVHVRPRGARAGCDLDVSGCDLLVDDRGAYPGVRQNAMCAIRIGVIVGDGELLPIPDEGARRDTLGVHDRVTP